jgi:hypothetical protein
MVGKWDTLFVPAQVFVGRVLNVFAERREVLVKIKWTAPALAMVLLTSGCATMQSHDEDIFSAQVAAESGSIEAAIAKLDATAPSPEAKKQILYNLERAELLRLGRQYSDSNAALLQADEIIKQWEETATSSPSKPLSTLGAAFASEKFKPYEGQDYEKVMLTTRLALNRMALGDWENARIDIRRTHEREALIAALRAREIAQAEEHAREQGVKLTGQEINGYPVETINDAKVLALKNGYQNALSHYLAGFLYEVLNEPGLAAPGYRKAIEIKPHSAILEDGLRELEKRTQFTHRRQQRKTDVLFLIEAGSVPARKPVAFTVPVPTERGFVTASFSYPVITPSLTPHLSSVQVGPISWKPELVVDFNLMARRALKDEMPRVILRGATRLITKTLPQDQATKKSGLFLEGGTPAASIATEQPDERMWRMLPERVYVVRGYLAPGDYWIKIDDQNVGMVKVDGQYAVVPVRLFANTALVGNVATFGVLPPVSAAPSLEVQPSTKKGRRKASQTQGNAVAERLRKPSK